MKHITLCLAGLISTYGALHGQPASEEIRDRLRTEMTTTYSRSGKADLEGLGLGTSVTVNSYEFSLRATSTMKSPRDRFWLGVEWHRHDLGQSGPVLLPECLERIVIPIGGTISVGQKGYLLANLQPQFTGADGGASADGFNLPVLAMYGNRVTKTFGWGVGFRYNANSDYPFLPLAGFDWGFAPGWEVRVAWPETGVSYEVRPGFKVRGFVTVHGGDFWLEKDPRATVPAGTTSFADSWLEYREVRIGTGMNYAFSPEVALKLDAGLTVSQRFEYFERDRTFDGGTPFFATVSVSGRF